MLTAFVTGVEAVSDTIAIIQPKSRAQITRRNVLNFLPFKN